MAEYVEFFLDEAENLCRRNLVRNCHNFGVLVGSAQVNFHIFFLILSFLCCLCLAAVFSVFGLLSQGLASSSHQFAK